MISKEDFEKEILEKFYSNNSYADDAYTQFKFKIMMAYYIYLNPAEVSENYSIEMQKKYPITQIVPVYVLDSTASFEVINQFSDLLYSLLGYDSNMAITHYNSLLEKASNTQIELDSYKPYYPAISVKSLNIPDSVTSIAQTAFKGCSEITSIQVTAGNTHFRSEGNCLVEAQTKTLVLGCQNSIIPPDGSVAYINDYAFCGCSGLESITIPESVTSIGEYAFCGCSALASITIPESVTSIGEYAFCGCSALNSIAFEDTTDWYRTTNSTDWQNQINGVPFVVTNTTQNATDFKGSYCSYYLYKK